jgi:MFS family permease
MNNYDKYKSSRTLYIIEAAIEYFISILVGTTYLAKMTISIGISDGVTGILSSFISLGFGFQIFSLFIANKRPIKRIVIILHLINELAFAFLYLVPVVPVSKTVKVAIFVSLLLMAEMVKNILYSPKMTWLMGLVPNSERGLFTAKKEIVSLTSGMIISFLMGALIDFFEEKGEMNNAFITGAITMLLLTALHLVLMIFIKEKPVEVKEERIGQMLRTSLFDKNLIKLIPLFSLWAIASYISTPFYGTYQISDLKFGMTEIAIIAAVASIARALFSAPIGKLADKRSFATMLTVCFIFAMFSYGFNIFFGKAFMVLHQIFYAISMAGINSGTVNLIYDYVPLERRTGALAIKNTVVGFIGFGATLLAKPLIDTVQASGNTFLGFNIHAQQILSAISVILIATAIIYLNTIVKKMNKEI